MNQWAYYQWGLSTDIPVPGDFDGDGRTDLAVYRPSTGRYRPLLLSRAGTVGLPPSGRSLQRHAGRGRLRRRRAANLAVYRPTDGGWYIRYSSIGFALSQFGFQWGLPTDTPIVADFDGDGRTDLAVYRPSDGGWYIRDSSNGYSVNLDCHQWGLPTDTPVPADFDGDGKFDLAVFRPSDGG